MKDTERKRQRHRQREKQAYYGEPDVGLDSRTLGSHPEPKADAQPLSCSGIPTGQSILSVESSVWYIPSMIKVFCIIIIFVITLSLNFSK